MITVDQLAKLVEGVVEGDGSAVITGMAPLSSAVKGDITFALSEKDFMAAVDTQASCVLTTMGAPALPKTLLRIKNPKTAVTILYNAMTEIAPPPEGGVHPSAVVSAKASIGKNVSIGPNVFIDDGSVIGDRSVIEANSVIGKGVKIGEGVRIAANVTIYKGVKIGSKVIIHAGTVIGADGFGFITKDGRNYKVPQMGAVIIEDEVEIGANSCIDRATFGDTFIAKGTKVDNLVQIAHNVNIGRNVLIAAQTGIAGSATIGENTMMGGQVGIADHAKVGSNVKLAAKTGVSGRVPDDVTLFGYPARDARETKKINGLLSLFARNASEIKRLIRGTMANEPEQKD
ncbi:MAG: UDP-3-O-(3-hydroxymyristoyl)glucosamine N-acyltransferase [Candidatus Omnitrophica bacterium]|nr:UDP-3-O-(3-hydroxymyristoyl)glucosamine N-acyltransferase [Candidatus Omnitrophota bacterium]